MKITNKHNKYNKSRKYKKKSSTRRKKIGGSPKINFAYTYLLITYEDIINNNLIVLNKYITYKSKICNCLAIQEKSMCDKIPFEPLSQINAFKKLNPKLSNARLTKIPGTSNILNDTSQKLILVMKYDIVQQISQDIQLLETQPILQQILGHTIINEKTHNSNNVIAIYDVCLHQIDKIGYGSVLFNLTLICIDVKYSQVPNLILWLGIRTENIQFAKVAYIYTSAGFKDPYITNIDPWNQKLDFDFISLNKFANYYVSDENVTVINYNKTMDLYNQYQKMKKDINETCKLYFTLDKSAILRLRMFPYLGVEGITNISESDLQRECSGIFKIYNSYIDNNGNYVYKLSLETLSENKGIKYIVGGQEEVYIEKSAYNFHTHPISLYVKYNVLIGTPSGADIYNFLKDSIYSGTQFTGVISIEGIYIVSLTPFFIKNVLQKKDNLLAFVQQPNFEEKIRNIFEFPFSQRFFSWKTDSDLPVNAVALKIQEYLNWFRNADNLLNSFAVGGGQIFKIQIFPWKQLNKNTLIQINYSSIFNNCFANSNSAEILKKIHGVTNIFDYTKK